MLGRFALTIAAVGFVLVGPVLLVYIWMFVDINIYHGLGLITMYTVLSLIIVVANELAKTKESQVKQTNVTPQSHTDEQLKKKQKQESVLR